MAKAHERGIFIADKVICVDTADSVGILTQGEEYEVVSIIDEDTKLILRGLPNMSFNVLNFEAKWLRDKLNKRTIRMTDRKETNPKDAVGVKKPAMSTVPATVLPELGLAMMEGARKYGRHNYRLASVRASVYYDAAMRHLMQWWEGEDIDPDSGLPHIVKAMASLLVLRDGQIQNKCIDDRPPSTKIGWMRDLQPQVEELFKKYPEAAAAFVKGDENK